MRLSSLLLLLCFCFLFTTAGAQTDPEGLERAWEFKQKFELDDRDGFLTLLESDLAFSRRAYLAAVEYSLQMLYEGKEEEGETGFLAAALVAEGLARLVGDEEPRAILKAFESEDSNAMERFFSYADQHHPGYREKMAEVAKWATDDPLSDVESAPARKVEADYSKLRLDPSKLPEDYRLLIRPYLAKLQRIHLTMAFAAPNLTMQELDGYDEVYRELLSQAKGQGPDVLQRVERDFAYAEPWVTTARLRILAEAGLLGEFNEELSSRLEESSDGNQRLDLLYAGFRMALRQGLWNEAESYLAQMQAVLSQDQGKSSPVFPFVLKTGRVQLELGRGKTFQDEELVALFEGAWSELSGFRAIQKVADDMSWHLVRPGAHFWIDQLTELEPQSNLDAILRITKDCSIWVGGISAFEGTLQSVNNEEALYYSEQFQGYLTVALSGLDTLIYVVEKWKPMLDDRENFAGVALSFPESLSGILESAKGLSSGLDDYGYPTLSLDKSFMLTELQARSLYLLALDPANTPEQESEKLRAAVEKFAEVDLPESYIDYHLLLGHRFHALGQREMAAEVWRKAYKMAVERGFVERSIDAAALLAREYGQLGRWESAQELASAASRHIQDQIGGSETRSGRKLAELNRHLAELQARAAIKAEKPELALQALAMNQQVQSASVRLEGNPEAAKATQKLQTKKRQLAVLSRKVKELEKLPSSDTRNELLEKAETLLAQSRSEFLLQSREIRKRFSSLYSTALRFDPLNLPDIQASLPPRTAVVQYFPTEEELFVFIVGGERFRLRSVTQKREELDALVLSYLRDIRRQALESGSMGEKSQQLYEILIRPVEEDLEGLDTVVLIPAGKLNLLPFASLKAADGKYLIEKKTLLELAKPTDFLKIALSKPSPVNKVIAFANATGDLPAAEKEGEQIVELFPEARLFKGTEANRQNFVEFGSEADVLHLATHGVWDTEDSLNNHLKLAGSDELGQEEIFDMQLGQTSLVTLSACNTAMGEHKDVEYVASLAEAFWIAGSRSVVASLWSVEDQSTQMLMTSFYKKLKEGTPKGQALREAQLAVREQKDFEHPYYWSGFLLFGDYR